MASAGKMGLARLAALARLATNSGAVAQLPRLTCAEGSSPSGWQTAASLWRGMHTSAARLGGDAAQASGETISVTFINEKDGSESTVQAPIGESMLEVAHANDVELEGACEGSLACSTCHVIVEDPAYYEKIPEADDDENDMLDLAFGLTDTSRLGCQVKATKDLDGVRLRIPSATRNFAVDGYVPKPH